MAKKPPPQAPATNVPATRAASAVNYLVSVDIRTQAPMVITATNKGRYDPSTNTIRRYGSAGVECSLTRTIGLVNAARFTQTAARAAGEQGEEERELRGQVPLTPIIPASTLTGRLRRTAANMIFDALIERDLHLGKAAVNTMSSGAATTSLAADTRTPAIMNASRNDPFLSVFGGTSLALPAHSIVAMGLPIIEATRFMLMTPPLVDPIALDRLDQLTEAMPIIRKNDVAQGTNPRLVNLMGLEQLAQAMQDESQQRAKATARKAAKKDLKNAATSAPAPGQEQESDAKTDLRTFNAMEVIRPGVPFALRFQVTAFTPAHLGLLLLGIQRMLQEGQIGGRKSAGMGRFVAEASCLYERSLDGRKTAVLSTLFGDAGTGYALTDTPLVATAVREASAYIQGADSARFEAFASADPDAFDSLGL